MVEKLEIVRKPYVPTSFQGQSSTPAKEKTEEFSPSIEILEQQLDDEIKNSIDIEEKKFPVESVSSSRIIDVKTTRPTQKTTTIPTTKAPITVPTTSRRAPTAPTFQNDIITGIEIGMEENLLISY